MRWTFSRLAHFSRATVFNQETGAVTPFELIAVVTIFAIVIAICLLSGSSSSGELSAYIIFITVIISLRNNILQYTLGISWERALLFHKMFGLLSFATAAIHGIPLLGEGNDEGEGDRRRLEDDEEKTSSGLPLLILIACQPILYVLIKPYFFELFYYLHMLIYLAMAYFAIEHGADIVAIGIAFWALDLLIRYLLTPLYVTVTAQCQPGDVVSLTFDKKKSYRAGQYVFLMIPSLGVMEWHPFTISSAPHELCVTLHVSKVGSGWTSKLADLVKQKAGADGTLQLTAFVEGPYGLPAVNLEDDTYQVVLLISGGIGVTPNQSIANDLLEAHARGRPMKKIVYVWALREEKMGLVTTMVNAHQFPTVSKALAFDALEEGETELSPAQAHSQARSMLQSGVLHTEIYSTRAPSASPAPSAAPVLASPSAPTATALPTACLATASSSNAPTAAVSAVVTEVELFQEAVPTTEDRKQVSDGGVGLNSAVIPGRPDFPAIFARVKEVALSLGERRVAVAVCGPAAMVASATQACRQATSSEVQFDLHVEIFKL